jgi:hypothetical protein
MKTKKKKKARIVKSDSINYTFIDDTIIPQTDSKQKEIDIKKKPKFVRNTLKDAKTAKIHYKSNSRSPKSQQNHSPVYE